MFKVNLYSVYGNEWSINTIDILILYFFVFSLSIILYIELLIFLRNHCHSITLPSFSHEAITPLKKWYFKVVTWVSCPLTLFSKFPFYLFQ